MGCHALFQGIFPTQRSNPHLLSLLHCRWILYPLSHLGILTNSPVLLPLVPGALMRTLGLDYPSVCTYLTGSSGEERKAGQWVSCEQLSARGSHTLWSRSRFLCLFFPSHMQGDFLIH